ncbi:MFS transporter [Actinomycetospora sp. Odt1-22]|uniref:MFS transporter n=2 Tax=Actinomycetospora termitidis TaxID=3053470 RepID=A0ABT7MAG6_9PSEU|nr:MFS transporter [Actinomycetospora sp. Odt1-22]MDL5157651.1 MFS transporter [Actinomycetospora sp. Odt1-22]
MTDIEPARTTARTRTTWWPWAVAATAFVALMGAAGFRSAPGVLIAPLHDEFGWSTATISTAVSINLVLYGVISPFAAALMERFGMRRVVAWALLLVAAGSGLTVFMTQVWQLMLLWGVLVGVGTGSMALAFVATVTGRWFVARRGLVSGVLTAAQAAGGLVFLPLMAALSESIGWRAASLLVAGGALVVVPVVVLFLRDHPRDVGAVPHGGTDAADEAPPATGGAARRALSVLGEAARTRTFWLLAGGFAICGATTVGLLGTHFVPAAHDHGMPMTTAAGLLAVVGVFDVVGTVLSGWLTDRWDPRRLLAVYYVLRGASLLVLPLLLAPTTVPPMWAFIVFYGLDWVATVPPTVALCRERFGARGPIVFGWVFASHQVGSALAAFGAGVVRDTTGSYDGAWWGAGALCAVAAVLSLAITRNAARMQSMAP